MATRAQLSQERSRLRREELLAAAIDLFAEGGSRAITHRAVAARAGLPSATTTYYFESIDELIREALASHIDRWAGDLEALSAFDLDLSAGIDDAAQLMSHLFAARSPEAAALELSIYLAAARVPELRDQAIRAAKAFEGLVGTVLERLGIPDAAGLAASIVTLIAGTALRRQSGAYTEDQEARLLTTALRQLVAGHLLGPDGVDRALTGLPETPR